MPGSTATVVYLHGAGSRGSVARDLLPASVLTGSTTSATSRIEFLEDRTGDVDALVHRLDGVLARLREAGETTDPDHRVILAGVSLGAHAIARWAARAGPPCARGDRIVLALPAWTGAPGTVARATASSAREIERLGCASVIERLRGPDSGLSEPLVDLIVEGWGAHTEAGLVAALDRAATQAGPSTEQLDQIRWPTLIVGLRDDPLHPLSVARTWRRHIPISTLVTASIADLGRPGNSGLRGPLLRGISRLDRWGRGIAGGQGEGERL